MPFPVRLVLLLLALTSAPAGAFSFEDVARRAEKLAAKRYQKPESGLPPALADLNYDQYRDIRFIPDRALWRGTRLPFEIQFFHLGFFYDQPVRVNLVAADGVRPLRYDPDDFDFGRNDFDPAAFGNLGFAGFRIHYPLNRPDHKDELAAFLGASYFRALGTGQRYGLSARGLAVDTALMSGEEFPRFTEFWIEWPSPDASELVVYALLDSRRVTGAYRFVIQPGRDTAMEVQARLYLRAPVGKLGLAPLTSMFQFGENDPPERDDYRPEVHDSDGLQIHTGTGEWLWRPLLNPRRLLVTSFAMEQPRGFGLMQRDRDFGNYQDLEARYDLRPSAWVEPRGNWGPGRVELVQIPTPDETNDNIVAYWVPDVPPRPGKPYDLRYRLSWQMQNLPPTAQVVQTRRDELDDRSLRLVLDFHGAALTRLAPDAPIEAVLWSGPGGEIVERQVFHNEVTDGWRLVLRVRRTDADLPLELRAFLRHGEDTVSETWSYVLPDA